MKKPKKASEVKKAILGLPGWKFHRDALNKTFVFADFRAAMTFMVRVGFEAEAMDHHPEWTNVYNRVKVRLNTHAAGGKVTSNDIELAGRMDKAAL